jgi:hypothetical protein
VCVKERDLANTQGFDVSTIFRAKSRWLIEYQCDVHINHSVACVAKINNPEFSFDCGSFVLKRTSLNATDMSVKCCAVADAVGHRAV